MGIFYREKTFHAGKKSGKITLPPQKTMLVTPLVDDKAYLHLDILSREPQSTYQGLIIPQELMNSEMYKTLDPKSKSSETRYQDVILNNSDLDEDFEYQVVLNDNLENASANYQSQIC